MKTIKLWDIPTRLFHWLLVLTMIGLFVTGLAGGGAMEWHGRLGVFVVALVAFRLAWGLWGSSYARFLQFFPSFKSLVAYLRGQWKGVGHNPFGALSVFALLSLSLAQAVLGLFTDDEIAYKGTLARLIDPDLAVTLTGWHHKLAWVLLAFICLHVLSIVFYALVKKHFLLPPMLTGRARVEAGESYRGGGVVAFILAFLVAAAAGFAASGLWVAEPLPPPESSAPAFDF
ncbi:MAG: cytochrome b/b6 domain-containing protein [Zoogloeaceae bacterium]|nr:cytochrome b/b6 domain-containing protein [Zoogloeaceae bacterium]